jgi:hypothetical protein
MTAPEVQLTSDDKREAIKRTLHTFLLFKLKPNTTLREAAALMEEGTGKLMELIDEDTLHPLEELGFSPDSSGLSELIDRFKGMQDALEAIAQRAAGAR